MSDTTKSEGDRKAARLEQRLLYLFTRTPLHVGAGSGLGAIDLPVQRERHSRHPIIPGSSIKGVLRFTAATIDELDQAKIDDMFGPELGGENAGKEARAGDLVFGEARPLAFPVRSARGAFAYVTCPLVLQRFARDSGQPGLPELSHPEDQECLAGARVTFSDKQKVVLEEFAFRVTGVFPADWESLLKGLVADPVWKEAAGRLVLLSDGDFSHFVTTATEISPHVKIDPKTGSVARGALFDLESVPAETLFFAPVQVIGRPVNKEKSHYQTDTGKELAALIERHPVLQFGGNSTTGRGFCSVSLT
ncbi:MAG: type III-B CRISPR module RAMP protein Cmr4 [Verrucomicrobiales bacterium]|nr:type III-B CRISPR module RAMP protein Cmr4 [Verrucomicrobiales bacterium]MCP5525935.1 type III-B CRISPR module RAMP protein Cmr4 [Verrucomicrobiales bacterium]